MLSYGQRIKVPRGSLQVISQMRSSLPVQVEQAEVRVVGFRVQGFRGLGFRVQRFRGLGV